MQFNKELTMKDYCFSQNDDRYGSSMVGPVVGANNFEIKPALVVLIQNNNRFNGFPREDPTQHLINFQEACNLVKFNGVSNDAIRL